MIEAAHGQAPPPPEPAVLTLIEAAELLRIDRDELERLAERGEIPAQRVGTSWRFSRANLMAWLAGSQAPATSPGQTVQDAPVGEAPEERTAEDVFLRGQRILLGRGQVVLDFGQFYTRSDRQQLATDGSSLGLATVEQGNLTTLVFGRLGIMEEIEVFASTTLQSQADNVFLGSTRLASSRRTGLGDVGVGLRHTLLREGAGRPDIVASIDGRIPRGDRSYGVGGTLSLVKSLDPVVLFASAGYHYGFSKDLSNGARLESGNRYDVSLGYGLALNDTLAISTAVSGAFARGQALDNVTLRQPGNFNVRLALTSWLARGLYIEPSVSFGLSGPGNTFAFGLTIPYTF